MHTFVWKLCKEQRRENISVPKRDHNSVRIFILTIKQNSSIGHLVDNVDVWVVCCDFCFLLESSLISSSDKNLAKSTSLSWGRGNHAGHVVRVRLFDSLRTSASLFLLAQVSNLILCCLYLSKKLSDYISHHTDKLSLKNYYKSNLIAVAMASQE